MQDCHRESSIQQEEDSFHQQTGLKFKEEGNEILHLEHGIVHAAEILTLRNVDQKCVGSFEIWYWRRMEFNLTDRLRNEEVLHRVKEKKIIHTVKIRKANWFVTCCV
jgi:hypothetical protein